MIRTILLKRSLRNPQAQLTPVVYSMGKVATSAISGAMQRAGLPVHHIHTLDERKLLASAKRSIDQGDFPAPHICESMSWRGRLFTHPDKCLYISLVRDPIARNLSAFFENIKNFLGPDYAERPPKQILDIFLTKYNHQGPLTWFDREFKAQLGIDVYATPFDKKAKYVRLQGSNTLIFRADCPDDVVARILSESLGQRILVTPENVSATKAYGDTYKQIKAIARFAPKFLDTMYDTDFVRHFWTEEEINTFREQWRA